MPAKVLLALLLVVVVFYGLTGGQTSAQSLSWDIIDEPFDAIGFFRNMLGPIGNMVIEKRPIAWTATVAGIEMDGYGAMYIVTYPPDFESLSQRIPLLAGFNPFGNENEPEERTDLFVIELLHPFLRGSNNFNGAFAGKAGPRRIGIPNWMPYEDADARDHPDRSYLSLEFSASSPLAVKDDPDQSYSVYGDRGSLVVYEMDRGFYATARVLLKPSVPVLGDAPFEEAVIDFRLCEVAPEDEGRVFGDAPCLVGDVFQVLEHWPESHRENVDFKDPAIRVAFSDRLSSASLTGNVDVFTMSSSGEELKVPGTARVVDGNQLLFIPDHLLWDGVIYEVRIRGGEDGVRSVNHDILPADFAWHFSTVIDIESRFIPGDFHHVVYEDLPPDGPIQSFVYQSVRDAMLIPGKPTLTRVFVYWKPYDHIAAHWQPTSFWAEVRIEDSHDGPVYTNYEEPFLIVRPDQFTSLHRRFAQDSIKLFNWRPLQVQQSTSLSIEIEPYDVYPMPRDEYRLLQEKPVERWPYDPKHFTFDYYFIKAGPWKEDVPAVDARTAHVMARSAERYITQIFPVLSTTGRFAGEFDVEFGDRIPDTGFVEGTVEVAFDALNIDRQGRYIKRVMQRLHNLHGGESDADVLVGFVPLASSGAGQSYTPIDYKDWGFSADKRPDFVFRTVMLPVWPEGPESMGLAHEIGHAYHLHHQPEARTKEEVERVAIEWAQGFYPGIEGFRIAPGGTHGWNKSSIHGNAEDKSTLLSFMFPVSRTQAETFIMNSQYESLLRTLQADARVRRSFQTENRHSHPFQVASADLDAMVWARGSAIASFEPVDHEESRARKLLVAGYIHKEDGTMIFNAVRRRLTSAREGLDGPYTAVAFDDQGRLLAAQSFGEYVIPLFLDDDDEWMYFQVALPELSQIASIEIRKDHEVLGKLERPEEQLKVAFVPSSLLWSGDGDDTQMTVAWDGQGENVAYTLMYSADGAAPWQILVVDTTDTTVTVDTRHVQPGENPTLRLIASNLFDEVEDRMPIELKFKQTLQPLWLNGGTDGADGTVRPLFDVEVTFNRDLDVDSLVGRFTLVDENGKVVPSTYQYDPHTRVVLLTPTAPLSPGAYTARFGPGVADRWGSVLEEEATRVFYVEVDEDDPFGSEVPHFFDALPLTSVD